MQMLVLNFSLVAYILAHCKYQVYRCVNPSFCLFLIWTIDSITFLHSKNLINLTWAFILNMKLKQDWLLFLTLIPGKLYLLSSRGLLATREMITELTAPRSKGQSSWPFCQLMLWREYTPPIGKARSPGGMWVFFLIFLLWRTQLQFI